jgi:hypothetical protein
VFGFTAFSGYLPSKAIICSWVSGTIKLPDQEGRGNEISGSISERSF